MKAGKDYIENVSTQANIEDAGGYTMRTRQGARL